MGAPLLLAFPGLLCGSLLFLLLLSHLAFLALSCHLCSALIANGSCSGSRCPLCSLRCGSCSILSIGQLLAARVLKSGADRLSCRRLEAQA